VYVRRGLENDPVVRVRAVALAAGPDDVICGRTAAWLYGVWRPVPGSVVPLEVTRPVRAHGAAVGAVTRYRRVLRGTPDSGRPPVGIRHLDEDVAQLAELRVTSALRTCFDLMRERALVEAVVVADAFAFAGALDLTALTDYCSDGRRWPHVRAARTATMLAHVGSRSPGESRLRMVVVLAGYEEPLVNVPVHTSTGDYLGTPDLTLRGRRWVYLEYDGAYHDEAAQHGRDLRRQNGLIRAGGPPLLRFDRRHVLHQRALVLHEVATACGESPRSSLDDADFRRPLPTRAW
ncbi:MAG TPA: hypothetical protein VF587_10835, partial [Solirubrobacteraceae bacterium]